MAQHRAGACVAVRACCGAGVTTRKRVWPSVPKTLRRQLSADEQFHRYFRRLEAKVMEGTHVRQVMQVDDKGNRIALQIVRVYVSPEGSMVEVR